MGNVTYMFGREAAEQMELPYDVDDTVNIPIGEYEELIADSLFLYALEEAGVDNWEGYGEALSTFDVTEEGEVNGN